jgi:D-serine deaminase-like pyridoxal phosphate-dependent protein
MAPQIAELQMNAGAYAITVANLWQADIFREFGFKKIIIANEILDQHAIKKIAIINKSKKSEIIFYIDSLEGLKLVEKHTPSEGVQNLLIEIGTVNGRGGVRDLELVREIAMKIQSNPRLNLRGVTGFEGAVPNISRTRDGENLVVEFCKQIVEAAQLSFKYKSDDKFIISAGGSGYFDIVAKELNTFNQDKILLLRSGAYVTHDSKYYEEIYPFKSSLDGFLPAIEIWAQVISKPEAGFGVLNLGKRDVGNDLINPTPILRLSDSVKEFSGEIGKLNDQHAFLKSRDDFNHGDLIGLGVSHPCTTFDKWRLIPLVNSSYDVVDCISTFF